MTLFPMESLNDDQEGSWIVESLDVSVREGTTFMRRCELRNDKMGVLRFGRRPEGNPGWCWAENGGGGGTAIPYALNDQGELYVGLIREKRANMGGERWCVIGGFKDLDESHDAAAVREAYEEAGLDLKESYELPGLRANFNRAFAVADPEKGEGVSVRAMQIPWSLLQETDDGYGLKPEAQMLVTKGEQHVRFMPWKKAVHLGADVLARNAIVLLLAHLDD